MGYSPDEEVQSDESQQQKSKGHGHKKKKDARYPSKRKEDDEWGDWGEDTR